MVSFKNKEKHEKDPGESPPWIICLPNPVKDYCMIRCFIPESCNARFIVYDLYGRRIKTIQEGLLGAGTYNFLFDGTDSNGKKLESGVYVVRLEAGRFHTQTKLLIVK